MKSKKPVKFWKIFLLGLFLVSGTAAIWMSGINLHLDAVKDYFEPDPQGPYVCLELSEGYFDVGTLVHESPESVRLKWGKKELDFEKSRIRHRSTVENWEINSGKYSDWVIPPNRRPLWTKVDRVEEILKWIEKRTGINIRDATGKAEKTAKNLQSNFARFRI